MGILVFGLSGTQYPDRLFLNKAGIDVTKGKLLLILEREGNQPLEVELPQK